MSWLRVLASRICGLFSKGRLECEFDEELRAHIEMATDVNLRKGMSAEEARYAARREFGGIEQAKEVYRGRCGWSEVDTLIQDVRFALRVLSKNPSFTIIAVLTLAVGIGVNTAIFTAYNAVALRPLDVPDSGRVVQVGRTPGPEFFSYPEYAHLRDNNTSFSGLIGARFFIFSISGLPPAPPATHGGIVGAAGFQFPEPLSAAGAEPVVGVLVSANYFKVLGTGVAVGRSFIPGEEDSREGR